MKAKVTWKGEDDSNTRFNEWRGIKFEAGKAVETEDPYIIAKAAQNPFYEVRMDEGKLPEPGTKLNSPLPPSQMGAQKPAEKPGEPASVTASTGAPQSKNPTLPQGDQQKPQTAIKRPGQ